MKNLPVFFIAILSLLHSAISHGEEVLVLHSDIGAVVDLEERIHYDLFPEISGFVSAQFYKVSDDLIEARIQYMTPGGIDVKIQNLRPYELYLLSKSIQSEPPLTDEKRREIQKKFQPLFYDRFLAEVPENSICFIKIQDGRRIKGLFYKATRKDIQLWSEGQVISVPLDVTMNMKYWKKHETYPLVYISSLIGATILCALTTEVINTQEDNPWFNRFLGASIGIVVGYKTAPMVNNMFIPTERIDFR